ncbi:hypothetical protein ACI3LY_005248 [Candidozyma auris]|uniref:Inositol polyphosphate-related phosphatase domain-containing protein n=2 Tax=Candidozyma auris TaxID=498019 RepID=A0AB36VZA8_CANAR|nr:phosphoinositide 5-phosphatase INP54 [[Candida] auris]KND96322.2 hypothetical protein QG37_07453 [[Candida] auris]PIS49785.1 hypothetical protein B9J08_004812 [[Candida] auris]PIS49953.1 hypothetical protein CJI97_004640 [[Candida] auris]QEO23445.1 hypothetical_protein [[Candida] auris]QWW25281.1 hypothetical protein CA7LBN_004163 [[Candida] auris]
MVSERDSKISLFLTTFNVAKQPLHAADYISSVAPALPEEPCHLYVFGFQEFCSVMDSCFEEPATFHLIQENRIALDTLRNKYGHGLNFTTIGFCHVGATGIFAITPFPSRFRDCKTATVSCGNGGSSLKGGAGIRVRYVCEESEPTELTFANAHLGAYEGEVYYQRRVKNVWTVMRALDFGDGYSFLKPTSHGFFMGDLNFRTCKNPGDELPTAELSRLRDQTHESYSKEDVEKLVLKYDELLQGKSNGDVFTGFSEACISFTPTYKYHPNTAIYNSKRCPSWCDRILFQNTYRKNAPEVHAYNSIDTYLRSDHRPVYLHITVPHDAPESMIGHNGNLVILPSAVPSRHVTQATRQEMSLPEEDDLVSGPTSMYMKCTAIDKLKQLLVRRVADTSLGYGVWLGSTPKGRLTLLVAFLLIWILIYLSR